MPSRRALVTLVALLSLTTGGVAGAAVLARGNQPEKPSRVESVHRYYGHGPSVEYGNDYGSLVGVEPLRFEVTEATPQGGIVTASFAYRTHGAGPFEVTVGLRAKNAPRPTERPSELRLPPAPNGDVATVRFLVPHLQPGGVYTTYLGVNSVSPPTGTNWLRTRKVLLTVDLE